ncbi:hypothetical protein RUND412_006158 [Rhizina undulata]
MCNVELTKYLKCGHTVNLGLVRCENSSLCTIYSCVDVCTVRKQGQICYDCFNIAFERLNDLDSIRSIPISEDRALRGDGQDETTQRMSRGEAVEGPNFNVRVRPLSDFRTTSPGKKVVTGFTERALLEKGFVIVDTEEVEEQEWEVIYKNDIEEDYEIV